MGLNIKNVIDRQHLETASLYVRLLARCEQYTDVIFASIVYAKLFLSVHFPFPFL